MVRFLVRSVVSTIVTVLLVSIGLFLLIEVGSGDISVKILGVFATPEQRASYRAQLGLNAPVWQRYLDWLVGNDWRAKSRMTYPLITLKNPKTKEMEWWADIDGQAVRWKMDKGKLKRLLRQEDGFSKAVSGESDWMTVDNGETFFWGVDNRNNAVKWVKGSGEEVWVLTKGGLRKQGDGPREYIPLRKGLIRGDAGMSWQYNRPVSVVLKPRIRNTLILAGVAFVVVMPLALFSAFWPVSTRANRWIASSRSAAWGRPQHRSSLAVFF